MNPFELYLKWLQEHTKVEAQGEWTEITIPFLDRHNDQIQFYAKVADNKIELTDGGSTLAHLAMSGFTRTEKRADILATIFRGFNTQLTEGNQIYSVASEEDVGFKFQNFLQTIISTDNLGYFSEENVKAMFFEDVSAWLAQNEVSYVAKKEFAGRSGYSVDFPFFIPNHKRKHSSVIQLINNPKTSLKPLLFEWIDTEDIRGGSQNFTLINDDHIKPSAKLFKAFEKYEVEPVLWSNRDYLLKKIA
ncbi:DUF1828 domain-containing protein [Bdellovibrio bacteriovorus]|uniref:DUF1828 domain-containing protein n=1 Tax=Bdellovibrio bacteriovorus TaxID=959 RepID=UPI0035A5C89C